MLASKDLAAGETFRLWTNGGARAAAATLNVVNRNTGTSADAKVRVAIVAGTGTPGAANWIEYDAVLGAAAVVGNSPLLRDVVLDPSDALWVMSDKANVSAVLWGIV